MPHGLPSADDILCRRVQFFSLDTNVIHGKGFRFDVGALHVLKTQRPKWMTVQMTEVVVKEVFAQRMETVLEADKQLITAISTLKRHAAMDVEKVNAELVMLKIQESAQIHFESQINRFVSGLDGGVLLTSGDGLAGEMFRRYFAVLPPFENRSDKKSEFPDAAALLVLEEFAEEYDTKGILISNDRGWAAFAAASSKLYCVKTLEEFTNLFAASDASAAIVVDKVRNGLRDPTSDLYAQLVEAIRDHAHSAGWRVGDLYSGYNLRLEGYVYETSVEGIAPYVDDIRGWIDEENPSQYLVELTVCATVEVSVDVTFFHTDGFDRDESSMGSETSKKEEEIEIGVFLICTGEFVAAPVEQWDVEIEIASADYSVDLGEVNPDFGGDED